MLLFSARPRVLPLAKGPRTHLGYVAKHTLACTSERAARGSSHNAMRQVRQMYGSRISQPASSGAPQAITGCAVAGSPGMTRSWCDGSAARAQCATAKCCGALVCKDEGSRRDDAHGAGARKACHDVKLEAELADGGVALLLRCPRRLPSKLRVHASRGSPPRGPLRPLRPRFGRAWAVNPTRAPLALQLQTRPRLGAGGVSGCGLAHLIAGKCNERKPRASVRFVQAPAQQLRSVRASAMQSEQAPGAGSPGARVDAMHAPPGTRRMSRMAAAAASHRAATERRTL